METSPATNPPPTPHSDEYCLVEVARGKRKLIDWEKVGWGLGGVLRG